MAQQTEYLATFLEQTGASIPQFCRKMYFLVMPFLASTYHIEMNFWSSKIRPKVVNIEVFLTKNMWFLTPIIQNSFNRG